MTTNSPASSSDGGSQGFALLDVRIQRWIWSEGWTALRDAQEKAIPALIDADRDVIIAAATAAGKTEAAFFPILTHMLRHEPDIGSVLYISPLKALINDQWGRLMGLCDSLDIPVVAWHGDVAASRKHKFIKNGRGVLLITPESLEALFVRRGTAMPGLMSKLRYVVVDELHAFIGSERGKQLQSLMCRLERAVGRGLPRVGLSATLGDMGLAAQFLRSDNPDPVDLIEAGSGGQELKILVKGYVENLLEPMDGLRSTIPRWKTWLLGVPWRWPSTFTRCCGAQTIWCFQTVVGKSSFTRICCAGVVSRKVCRTNSGHTMAACRRTFARMPRAL